jgi:hypothetical protein
MGLGTVMGAHHGASQKEHICKCPSCGRTKTVSRWRPCHDVKCARCNRKMVPKR